MASVFLCGSLFCMCVHVSCCFDFVLLSYFLVSLLIHSPLYMFKHIQCAINFGSLWETSFLWFSIILLKMGPAALKADNVTIILEFHSHSLFCLSAVFPVPFFPVFHCLSLSSFIVILFPAFLPLVNRS